GLRRGTAGPRARCGDATEEALTALRPVDTNFVFHENRVTRSSCNHLPPGIRGMKNVTVTMEDTVADWTRMEAARRNTSVSRLIGELLAEKMRHDDAYARAMREELEFKSIGTSDGRYLTREEMYDRER